MTTESVIAILENAGLARPTLGEEDSKREQEVRYEGRIAPPRQAPSMQISRRQEQKQAPRRRNEYWASGGDRRSDLEYQYPRKRGRAPPRRQQEQFYWPTNNRFEGSLNY